MAIARIVWCSQPVVRAQRVSSSSGVDANANCDANVNNADRADVVKVKIIEARQSLDDVEVTVVYTAS